MTRKTIYLHIGIPKTGTTTIQKYLVENRGILNGEGFLVPWQSRKENINHIYLVNYAADESGMYRFRFVCNTRNVRQIRSFRKKFKRDLRNEIMGYEGSNVILSNEHCYKYLTSTEELIRLRDLFEGLYDELKIIVYIREQSEHLCSQYSTAVKNSMTKVIMGIEDFAKRTFYNYNEMLRPWEEVFGIDNIVLRVFDREKLTGGDIISDFCHITGMKEHKSQELNMNVSLNVKQCEFLRIINSNLPNLRNPNGFWARGLINRMVTDTNIEGPSVQVLIDSRYQGVFDQSNIELAKRYFGCELEIFTKKPLGETSLDQTTLLTEYDKQYLVDQIIESYGKSQPELCRCIAAIFGLSVDGRRVDDECVDKFIEKLTKRKRAVRSFVKRHIVRIIRK